MSLSIRVEDLGKRYRIGAAPAKYRTVRDLLASTVRSPLARLKAGLSAGSTILTSGEVWAVDGVSFEVEQGEVVGLVGRNGAGKTTLLKILSRITEPTRGRAELRGRVASLLEVGTGFHPELTGRENIYLNGAILGMGRAEIEAKFDEIVAFAEVERFIDTQVKHYSSGMYLRLAFAVAAHLEPEILLVDEVLAVGDASFQRKCLGKMSDVARSGRTVLFVSHNMEAVQRLCERCLWIDAGRVREDGPTEQVVPAYLHLWSEGVAASYRAPQSDGAAAAEETALLAAEVLDGDGRSTDFVRFGEPFSIHMRWRNHKAVPGSFYFVRVTDEQGRQLFTVNHRGLLDVESAGDHAVVCRFDHNVLVPGRYWASLGCFLMPKTFLHHVENALGFSVLETAAEGGAIAVRSIFDPRPTWRSESQAMEEPVR